MIKLFQVDGEDVKGKFTAGFCVDVKNTIWKAAPKLKWLEEKPLYVAESYCRKRGWNLYEIPNDARKEKEGQSLSEDEAGVHEEVLEQPRQASEGPTPASD